MAAETVTELCVMQLRPDANFEEEGGAAHKTWQEIVASLKQAEGCNHVFVGRQAENPSTAVLCSTWSSYDAADSHQSSLSKISSLVTHSYRNHVALGPDAATVEAVLTAPTTEVFTAFGAELPQYLDNTRVFAEALAAEAPEGFYGAAYGTVAQEIAKVGADGQEGEKGPAVRLVIGWESEEAHEKAKGRKDGAIMTNIHLLRELRKEVELYHVSLREQ